MKQGGEVGFVAVLIIFSAAALWQSYGISGFSKWSSPGVFPMLASAVMLLSALFVFRDIKTPRRRQTILDDKTSAVESLLPARVVVIALLLILYVLAMPTLGFLLCSGIFLIVSIGYLWTKPWWQTLVVSLMSLVVIHIVFRVVFQVILPQGTLVKLLS